MTRGRVRWASAALILLAVAARAGASVLVVKVADGTKTVAGWIVEQTDHYVAVRTQTENRVVIPRAVIVQITPACEEKELEALSPKSPEGYVRLGKALLGKAEDPEARELGRHVLLLGAKMDPAKWHAEAYRALVEAATDDATKAECVRRLLIAQPGDAKLADEFHDLRPKRDAAVAVEVDELIAALEACLRGSADEALRKLQGARTAPVRRLIASMLPDVSDLRSLTPERCPDCKGQGRKLCSTCKGTGKVKCGYCQGTGKQVSTERVYDSGSWGTSGSADPGTAPPTAGLGAKDRSRLGIKPGKESGESSSPSSSWTPPSSRQVRKVSVCANCRGGWVTCGSCGGKAPEKCEKCGGTGRLATVSPVIEAKVRGFILAAEGMRDWWRGGPKAPRLGTLTFDDDIDYAKTVYRAGAWATP